MRIVEQRFEHLLCLRCEPWTTLGSWFDWEDFQCSQAHVWDYFFDFQRDHKKTKTIENSYSACFNYDCFVFFLCWNQCEIICYIRKTWNIWIIIELSCYCWINETSVQTFRLLFLCCFLISFVPNHNRLPANSYHERQSFWAWSWIRFSF